MKIRFKKFLIAIVALVSLFGWANITAPIIAASDPAAYHESQLDLKVKSALAIDSHTGQILYAKNANQALPIASMTKLVTIYLTLTALKQKRLTWKTKVEPTPAIVKVANNSEYSNVPLKRGHLYTIRQLYQATLIESANGAAMCLAQAVAGSQSAFVRQMRTQVKKWGIKDAKLYTVNGLPNGNLGKDAYPGVSKKAENAMSARDMALVGKNLIDDYPQVLKTTKIAHLDFKDENQTTVMANFDWMLKGLSQYDPRYKVDGLKTGTTDAAGACFIGTLHKKGSRIITVVMGARHRDGTDPARFTETKKLMNYIYSHYTPVILKSGTVLAKAKQIAVTDGHDFKTNVGVKKQTAIWDPVDGKQVVGTLTKKTIAAPIKKGQTVSSYQFKSGQEKLISLNNPEGMKASAQALQANAQVNIFVRFWRWLTGAR